MEVHALVYEKKRASSKAIRAANKESTTGHSIIGGKAGSRAWELVSQKTTFVRHLDTYTNPIFKSQFILTKKLGIF